MRKSVTILFTTLTIIFSACEIRKSDQVGSDEAAKDSPVGVLRTFIDAKNNKDAETMKRTLSKSTLKAVEEVAGKEKLTLEESLNKGDSTPLNNPEMPETRNQQIGNDTATIEIKRYSTDKWKTLTFLKEDGLWKMDLIRFLDELYPDLKH